MLGVQRTCLIAQGRGRNWEQTQRPQIRQKELLLSIWRDLAADFSVLQNCSTWNDALLMMCKKCYNDYDKLVKLKRSIMRNLTDAAEKLVDVSSSIPKEEE